MNHMKPERILNKIALSIGHPCSFIIALDNMSKLLYCWHSANTTLDHCAYAQEEEKEKEKEKRNSLDQLFQLNVWVHFIQKWHWAMRFCSFISRHSKVRPRWAHLVRGVKVEQLNSPPSSHHDSLQVRTANSYFFGLGENDQPLSQQELSAG